MSDDLDFGVTSALILPTPRATPAELLALAQGRAPDPAAFDGVQPFFWPSEISNGNLDAYYGRMHESTLRNFAADAAAGVSVLLGHNAWSPSFGMSLTGIFEPAQADRPARTISEAYTIPGLTTDRGMTSDEMIRRLRTGIQRDISVGFHLAPRADGTHGRYVCDICGGNLMDWRACPHWPGIEYEATDPVTGQTSLRLSTFTVFNATLSEYSAVYDGATPGAAVIKARAADGRGELDDRQIQLLEQRYRTRLPARRLVSPGVDLPAPAPAPEEESAMTLAADLRIALSLPDDADEAAIVGAVRALQVDAPADPTPAIRSALGLAADADLAAALPTLRQQAADGRAYRADLETQALAEAVRALGPDAEERYRPIVASAAIDSLRAMTADWASVAAQRLGPGGRRSADEVDKDETPTRRQTDDRPSDVYRV